MDEWELTNIFDLCIGFSISQAGYIVYSFVVKFGLSVTMIIAIVTTLYIHISINDITMKFISPKQEI